MWLWLRENKSLWFAVVGAIVIIFAGLIVLVLIFIIQNTQVVEFRFLIWTVSISRALMLFSTLAAGLETGWLMGRSSRKQKSRL